MIRGRPDYELTEHTADTGFIVGAASFAALLERAAAAMFDISADLERLEPEGQPLAVRVTARDRAELVVAWCSELLGRAAAANRVFVEIDVERAERGDDGTWEARGTARAARHVDEAFRTEIKAVTYHDLEVVEQNGAWSARIVLDL